MFDRRCGQQLFTFGNIFTPGISFHVTIHVAKANLPILRQSSFPTYGKQVRFSWHVVLIMYLRFWAKVVTAKS